MSRSKTLSSSSSSSSRRRRRRRADDDESDERDDVVRRRRREKKKNTADEEESTLSLSTATKHVFSIGWPTCLQNVSAAVASLFAVSLISHHEDTTCVAAYGLGTSLCSVTGHCFYGELEARWIRFPVNRLG